MIAHKKPAATGRKLRVVDFNFMHYAMESACSLCRIAVKNHIANITYFRDILFHESNFFFKKTATTVKGRGFRRVSSGWKLCDGAGLCALSRSYACVTLQGVT